MNRVILSGKNPGYSERLKERGFEIIHSETVGCMIDYEQDHADMQCLIIEDTAFVLKCCERIAQKLKDAYNVILCGENIRGKYPHNVLLNACIAGKRLIGKLDSIDSSVIDFCTKRGYELINVRQGYAKCSCAIISENALITADEGIYHSLKETKLDVLKIEKGYIILDNREESFIGGASGFCKGTVYFTGNIRLHPSYPKIKEFCDKYRTKVVSLSDEPLRDIGGIVFC